MQRHLQVGADEGVEQRIRASAQHRHPQRALAAGGVGHSGAGGIARQASQVPLHAKVQFTGEFDFENARLDLHLQRWVVEAFDRRFDLFPLHRAGADQQLVTAFLRGDPGACVEALAGRLGRALLGGVLLDFGLLLLILCGGWLP